MQIVFTKKLVVYQDSVVWGGVAHVMRTLELPENYIFVRIVETFNFLWTYVSTFTMCSVSFNFVSLTEFELFKKNYRQSSSFLGCSCAWCRVELRSAQSRHLTSVVVCTKLYKVYSDIPRHIRCIVVKNKLSSINIQGV